MSALFYRLVYRFGFTPWERLETLPAARQALAMLERIEAGYGTPLGRALDLGSGTGVWSVRLASRGWQVTGVELVPKAVREAEQRAAAAGVEVRFIAGDVSKVQPADIGSGYRLIVDFGTVHGLDPAQRMAVGQLVNAVAAPDASLLMYALAPRKRGMLPDGADRAELEAIYPGWKVVEEQRFDPSGLPESTRKDDPRWYRLTRG